MLYSKEEGRVPRNTFNSSRDVNPFLNKLPKTPLIKKDLVPSFGENGKSEKTKKIFDKEDHNNSQNECNFSFGEESQNATK